MLFWLSFSLCGLHPQVGFPHKVADSSWESYNHICSNNLAIPVGRENLFIIVPAKVLELTVIESAWVFFPFMNQSLWLEGRDRTEWNTLLGQAGLCGNSPLNMRWGKGTLNLQGPLGCCYQKRGNGYEPGKNSDVGHT